MSKLNQILLILLAVQGLGFVVTRATSSGPVEQKTVAFFAGLDIDQVTSVEILGAPPTEDGDPPQNKVTLAKKNGEWGIADADDFPVAKEKVDELLRDLAKLKSRNRVLDSSTYHDKLEVAADKYQRRITVKAGEDSTVLYVGSSPRFKNTHVRADGEDAVYLVNEFGTSQVGDRAWNWVDREYVNIPEDQVWQVKVKGPQGELQLDKDPVSKEWAVLGLTGEADKTAITGYVRQARTVNLETPVGETVDASYGLGDSATVVTLVTGTSTVAGLPPPTTETKSFRVGAKIESANQYYVKADDSPYVVKVAGFGVQQLMSKTTVDAFAKKEEKKEEDGQ